MHFENICKLQLQLHLQFVINEYKKLSRDDKETHK